MRGLGEMQMSLRTQDGGVCEGERKALEQKDAGDNSEPPSDIL